MNIKKKIQRLLKIAGPGLITGAADDDPSGIATHTQTGAQFGYNQLWTALFIFPLMTAVQEACARAPYHIWVLELALFYATINQIDHYTSIDTFLS